MTMAKKQAPRDQPGRYAYEGLDRVLHEKARLGIMTSLVTRPEGAVFNELKRLCAELEQVVRDALPKAARRPERSPDLPPGFQPA